jgi:sterol desaturase/sphingolipid hydroxylase (fatty acid hydroxylase superfamily)
VFLSAGPISMNPSSAPGIDAATAGLAPKAAAQRTAGALQRTITARAVAILGLVAYVAVLGAGWWGVLNLLPDHLHLQLSGHSLDIRNIHRRVVSDGALMFLLLPGALWIEWLIVGWEGSSARQLIFHPRPSNKSDLVYFLAGQAHLTDLLGRLLTLGVSMLSGAWLHDQLSAMLGVPLMLLPAAAPLPVQVVAFFLLYSFFDYWTHRLDHSRYFWPLHRYHHSADDFCVVTATRAHPAAFTGVFIVNMPMAVLGASPEVMVYVNVAVIALGFVIHSRIDSDFGWIGRWVIQSPTHHRLHHILDITVPVGHFSMAPIWDHLFGTWRGDADQSLVIGVEEPYRHGAWIIPDLARDYWHFWKGLVARR